MRDSKRFTYYIKITYRDDARQQFKGDAVSSGNAIVNLLRKLERNDIKYISCSEGIPVSGKAKREKLNHKLAQRARRKREKEAKIVKYDGLTRIE